MAEYRKEFVEKKTTMEKIPDSIMLASFVNGLKDHIIQELRIFEPNTLKKAMDWARGLDQKYSYPL